MSEDHEVSHLAALAMKQRGKNYAQFYVPNRSELALGRFFGQVAHVDALRHVKRSITGAQLGREWEYDIKLGDYMLDVKVPKPSTRNNPGITVTTLHPGVILIGLRPELPAFLEEFDAPRDITFSCLGWILSDLNDPAFIDMGGYRLVPSERLRPLHELIELVCHT
jgi:hypothetical protein